MNVREPALGIRQLGHIVHTPELYDGEVFSDRMDAVRSWDDVIG